jgi:hypothetical protein
VIPFELNWPCAKNSIPVLNATAVDAAWGQVTYGEGVTLQTLMNTSVTGVEVGAGAVVLEPPPQLKRTAVRTNASAGAITRHLFRHIEHQLWRDGSSPVKDDSVKGRDASAS